MISSRALPNRTRLSRFRRGRPVVGRKRPAPARTTPMSRMAVVSSIVHEACQTAAAADTNPF